MDYPPLPHVRAENPGVIVKIDNLKGVDLTLPSRRTNENDLCVLFLVCVLDVPSC